MSKYLFALISAFMMSNMAWSQVDTLHLVKTAGFQTPQPIWGFYCIDINGDNVKDFIAYSENHVYAINGSDFNLYWISPEVALIEKIEFADIDRNGTLDIIAKCSNNIKVFEPPAPYIFWTSPFLDYTYTDFAIGDRNGDLFPDIVIVRKEPFYRTGFEGNLDTVWVEAYSGPNFDSLQTIIMRIPNYDYYFDLMESRYIHYEYPAKVIIDNIASDTSEAKILIFFNLDESVLFHGFYSSWSDAGMMRVLRGSDLGFSSSASQGRNYFSSQVDIAGSSYILSLASNSSGTLTRDYLERSDEANFYRHGIRVRIDSLCNYSGSYDAFKMAGILMDEINDIRAGQELCFGGMISDISSHKLIQNSLESGVRIWQRSFNSGIDTILFKYAGPPFNHPQIVLMLDDDIYYRFYDGVTGNLSAVYNPEYYYISQITDLNADGIDEIVSRANDSICVFTLARTAISEKPILPMNKLYLDAYPNPFNGSVNIKYSLTQSSDVNIAIYNLSGQKVEDVIDGYQIAGDHAIMWDAGSLSSGVYYCKFSDGNFSRSSKLILLK
jgi:hypothetical protein